MTAKWQPIKDYESSPAVLADKEIAALSAVWTEQSEKLAGLDEFTERLIREWAVETGLIERLYTLDRGVTELLIERGLNAALIPHRSSANAGAGSTPRRRPALRHRGGNRRERREGGCRNLDPKTR